jgi:hypothetical protein
VTHRAFLLYLSDELGGADGLQAILANISSILQYRKINAPTSLELIFNATDNNLEPWIRDALQQGEKDHPLDLVCSFLLSRGDVWIQAVRVRLFFCSPTRALELDSSFF